MDLYITLAYIIGFIGIFATSFYALSLLDYKKKKDIPDEADDKKVTIIIPAYNEASSIKRTIQSVLNADYPEEKLEIIVIDDGSKDRTYDLAKMMVKGAKYPIRVYKKKNGGKGSALNFGLKKAKNEIIISMDADTFIDKKAIKKMIAYFYNSDIMSVTPSMGVYKPKGLWQRVQQIEYYLGVFLRKSFAAANAIHITPGAFSAYRKEFFDKYGGYDEGNITEDLEIALRIQSHDLILENASTAAVYTIAPTKFKELLIQRRRWYTGLIKNLWAYRRLFGFRTGALGTVVLPVAVSTVILSVTLTVYMVIRALLELRKEITFLNSINFEFSTVFDFSNYYLRSFAERMFFTILSRPVFILLLMFIGLLTFYLFFARKNMKYSDGVSFKFLSRSNRRIRNF